MCYDVEALVADMKESDIACGLVQNQGWGLLTNLTLPGFGTASALSIRTTALNSTSAFSCPPTRS